jgi:CheY-like chemotaxis protein
MSGYQAPHKVCGMAGTPRSEADRAGEQKSLVLVLEDDRDLALSLAALLEAYGFRTEIRSNGQEGLEAIEDGRPALIVSDLHMPGMDGFQLLAALRVTGRTIPVINVTDPFYNENKKKTQARRMGAVATFEKPVSADALIATVGSLLHTLDCSNRDSFAVCAANNRPKGYATRTHLCDQSTDD